ncbi:MAG TPA: bifunctional 5,10-methylenetetrahydrofolate dehydrogenase/5,10-methenyltetrahydrofolate cyclohydrolase [Flexivirga sp.]|uniref:bifunctional 5,10-methylenetetrahydrofolate dehydrogenase/5,10-methenyltetrahydrofolate cyclohydrolase n=1 Tax=Flexivirga sp. TaxID=1962927 RepID=UPI002C55D14B|nr:bifunctional 5,10-methylenetetrahydrofolate dehydrogenase/5,10-methenyltetrahydrofolate cyclohydrolase [Flexivirga sp.]HWC23474.1 bifunctional 5,10-methylenetetrahydrofolate dehydrogenase/5,10-methenyltetrahydrofolate cyclohydrolase [Flexivirga sp.]
MATTAQILDGTAVSRRIFEHVSQRAANFIATQGRSACLATVLIGDDPASHTYVRMKQRRARQLGLESRRVQLPAATTTDEAVAAVRALSEDDTVDGILVQHPAPAQVDELAVFEAIAPEKDVDGVTMHSFAAMGLSANGFHSCTPEGIIRLLDAYDVPVAGKRVCVVGRSAILGKPVGLLLLAKDATVTFCHSRTTDLAARVGEADIVVAAVGRPELVRGAWIKPGAVVVDAGYNPGNVGDVETAAAAARASYITPVPGGVGPMTIAVLMEQTVSAAENRVRQTSPQS